MFSIFGKMTSIIRTITRKSRNPGSAGDEVALTRSFWSKIHHFYIDHNTPYLSLPPPPNKKWHKHCFQFLLGTVVPREIEGNGCAKFCGENKVHYGLSKSREWRKISQVLRRANSKRSANKKNSKNSGVVSEKGNCNWFLCSAVINPLIKLRLIQLCTPPETEPVIFW